MDCEKFEATMLDELYGELDELTLAASKRHMGGCARCAAMMAGLKATRRVITLPVLAASEGFEDRILSAVRAAEASPKPKLELAKVISMAGRWAMRPQTAMAAVFLLMVGTSSVLLSRKAPKSSADAASASYTVTENGAPGPYAASPSEDQKVDPRAAASAHGTAPMDWAAPPAAAPAAPMAKSAPELGSEGSLAYADGQPDEDRARAAMARPHAMSAPKQQHTSMGGGAGFGAGPMVRRKAREPNSEPASSDVTATIPAENEFAPPPPSPAKDDALSALETARSVRESTGCQAAAKQFDDVANEMWGTTAGYNATLEGAQCYAQLGQLGPATSRYQRLLPVPSYAARAQAGINAISQVASSKARAVARPARPAAAAGAPATSPAASTPAVPPGP
jgi:hypothetical protein